MSKYYLMYKDNKVLCFDVQSHIVEILNKDLLPFSIKSMEVSYNMVERFCALRVLQSNRLNYDKLLNICGIIDNSKVDICILSKGLSLRDCYWIKYIDSDYSWCDVNLYVNNFTFDISKVALTGKESGIVNEFRTGELSGRGTRAKCFFRRDNNIFLAKNMTTSEISSECL